MPAKKTKKKPTAKAKSRAAKSPKKASKGRSAPRKKKPVASKSRAQTKPKAAKKGAKAKSKSRKLVKRARVNPENSERRALRAKRRGKPLAREFLFGVAKAIRDAVVPAIQSGRGRDVVGNSPSGDATFELDRIA